MEERRYGPIRFIPGGRRGHYPYCNSVYVEGAGVLIDPACGKKKLEELKADPGVREVWLTHWHEDHFKNLDLFEELPLRLSRLDAPPLASMEEFLDWYGFETEKLRETVRKYMETAFRYRPRTPAAPFEGGEVVDLGVCTVEVIPTPGHTPGHLSYFFREPGVLVMGDNTLNSFGPWYGDRDSSIQDTIDSVNRLRRVPARIWLSAHGSLVFEEAPGAAWDDYLDIIRRREEQIIDFIAEPRTLDEIADQWFVHGRPLEPKDLFQFGERATARKHLERLMASGAVELERERYRFVG